MHSSLLLEPAFGVALITAQTVIAILLDSGSVAPRRQRVALTMLSAVTLLLLVSVVVIRFIVLVQPATA